MPSADVLTQVASQDEAIQRQPQLPQKFSSVRDPLADPHVNGEYLKTNPTWHVEYSPWKAENIYRFMDRNNLAPKTVCEVGCGAGEVLRQLQSKLSPDSRFWGYDVSPQAIAMARSRENASLNFGVADFGEMQTPRFDLLLVLEVVDHVEDYFGFLRMLKPRGDLKIFSFSLDISVQTALRGGALAQRRGVHHHLHHFSKETALSVLKETGYEILDHMYPPPPPSRTSMQKLARPLRSISFAMNPDLSVRFFGGHSLLILAR
jgi:2-polyprenyl-3-methyl-5-hydroxy-6-metoxy-1,4-benzoquinol methylase